MRVKGVIEHIRNSAQLASILEVSGYPKPGNVHRTRDHPDTRYEHFLAGAVALGSSVELSAKRGVMASRGRIEISRIGVGRFIRKAVIDVANSHKGGNTHLGICLLFIPLSTAAARTYMEEGEMSISQLRKNFMEIMNSTTATDTINVYEAIRIAGTPKDLGEVKDGKFPDIYDMNFRRKIINEDIRLIDVMRESSSYDTVAKELSNGIEISSELGYKELMEMYQQTRDINIAIVHTFLRILSEYPDTFIARKIGLKKVSDIKRAVEIGIKETEWISETAREILNLGGLTTEEGRVKLWKLDDELQKLGDDYNPGTTADLTATSIMIALLIGLKY
jgi:triphosphoribosyl-dephospho-CoA synthase